MEVKTLETVVVGDVVIRFNSRENSRVEVTVKRVTKTQITTNDGMTYSKKHSGLYIGDISSSSQFYFKIEVIQG